MENSKLEPQDACSQWPASSRWSLHALEERQSYKSMYESVNIFACVSYTLRSRFRHIDFKVGSGFQFAASPVFQCVLCFYCTCES